MHGVVCGSGETCAAAEIPGGESVGMHRGQLETLPRPQRLQGAAELRRGAAGGNLAESAAKRTHAVQDMFQEKFEAMKGVLCVIVIVGAVALSSCTNKNSNERADTAARDAGYIGKYLYVDDCSIMHTRKWCNNLLGDIPADGDAPHCRVPKSIAFADTSFFYPAGNIAYCKECFDDAQYEHAETIFERNRPSYEQVMVLYEATCADGLDYGYIGNEFFRTDGYKFFLSGEAGYKIRRHIYDALLCGGYLDSETYEEFLRRLGFLKPKALGRKSKSNWAADLKL